MKAFRIVKLAVFSSLLFVLSGCGGGGGGSSTSTISGVAAKGPIVGGTVQVFALKADGTKGLQLGTNATTVANGSYPAINIGSYSGNVVIEVTGGTYKDEATGTMVANTIVKSALTSVSGKVSAAVTPLTDLAVQLATPLSTDSINKNNSLVSSMVGVDIIGTLPVDVTDEAASGNATQDQITYGLMLATISQMSDDQEKTQEEVLADLKTDLADGQLDDTGAGVKSGLTEFIVINPNNKSGVTATSGTPLTGAITYIEANPITPPANTSDLNKAKKMIADLRNTVLSIYNYQGVGAVGIVETPFKNLATEVETELQPELTNTVDRIGWVIETVSNNTFVPGADHSHFYREMEMLHLEIWVSADEKTYSFKIYNEDVLQDQGTVVINDVNMPTSGTATATFKTASAKTLTMAADYTAVKNATIYTSMTFTGSIKVPDTFEIDFSQSGRKLSAAFAPIPGYPLDIYPTSVSLSGLIKTKTTQLSGSISVPNITYSTTLDSPVPTTATINGVFEELNRSTGLPSGTKFTGTINGNWTNADSWNANLGTTPTNYPKWNATFNGKIEAPASPVITAYLKVTQSAFDKYALDVKYQRTNTDNSVIFISGTGLVNSTTGITTADLSNQDNLKINIVNDENLSKDERLTGTIKTSGGVKQADLENKSGIPSVKYIDNYFETLL